MTRLYHMAMRYISLPVHPLALVPPPMMQITPKIAPAMTATSSLLFNVPLPSLLGVLQDLSADLRGSPGRAT